MRTISIILSFLVVSCSYSKRDFELNAAERALFSSFHKGDTLYFRSSSDDIDTLLVLGRDSAQKMERGWLMAKPAYNEVWVSVKYIPLDTFYSSVFPNERTGKMDTDFHQLIQIQKLPQTQKVSFSFNFRHFLEYSDYPQLHSDTIELNNLKLTNYYVVEARDSNNNYNDTKALYFSIEKGLMAYQYKDGTLWTRTFPANKVASK